MVKAILFITVLLFSLMAETLIGKEASGFFMQDKNSSVKNHIKLHDEIRSGKGVVLAFYADWCIPSKKALPYLNELANSMADLSVIAISVDDSWGEKQMAILRNLGFAQPVIHDKEKIISREYNYSGTLPHTIYIKKDGTISAVTNTFSEAKKDKVLDKVKEITN